MIQKVLQGAALLALVQFVRSYYEWKKNIKKCQESGIPEAPKDPRNWSLLGNLQDNIRNLHRLYDMRLDNFNETNSLIYWQALPFFSPMKPFIMSADPAVTKHILKDNFNNYIKVYPGIRSLLEELIGDGIFSIDHGPHAQIGRAHV